MIPSLRLRGVYVSRRLIVRSYSNRPVEEVPANKPREAPPVSNVAETNARYTSSQGAWDKPLVESSEEGEKKRQLQAPNRPNIWSRSQQPREKAMVGPRFEQTIMEDQPRPQAAIELIHKQPVRWREERVVSCDGGGGPLGHPKIFINLDKPQICWCTYCGIPFANTHHRKHIEALPHNSYPLDPIPDPAVVEESQRITDDALGQR